MQQESVNWLILEKSLMSCGRHPKKKWILKKKHNIWNDFMRTRRTLHMWHVRKYIRNIRMSICWWWVMLMESRLTISRNLIAMGMIGRRLPRKQHKTIVNRFWQMVFFMQIHIQGIYGLVVVRSYGLILEWQVIYLNITVRSWNVRSQLFLKMIFMNLRMHSYRLENRQRRSTMLVCIRILMIWLENTWIWISGPWILENWWKMQ